MLAKTEANMSIVLGRRAAALIVLVAVGCVNRSTIARTGGSGVSIERGTRVTADELSRYAGGQSLMEALERVRPTLLVVRGARPSVSVDGAPPADQSILSSIPASDVFEVRLVRSGSAESVPAIRANGDVVVGDLLLVLTRKR
jgi:hypothetical protein